MNLCEIINLVRKRSKQYKRRNELEKGIHIYKLKRLN